MLSQYKSNFIKFVLFTFITTIGFAQDDFDFSDESEQSKNQFLL